MMKRLNKQKKYNPKLHAALIILCMICSGAAIIDLLFIYSNSYADYENASVIPSTNNGYYYQLMPKEMQITYNAIYKGIVEKKERIKIKEKEEHIKRIFYCLMFDNPELFYLSDTYTYDVDNGIVTTFYPKYTIKSGEIDRRIKQINSEVQKVKDLTKTMDSYSKELFIHEYLLKKCEYSSDEKTDTSLYGALIIGKTNCRGYSAAFSYLLNSCGVKSGQCIGTIENDGIKEGHSWNFVILNDECYYCDVCWDDIEKASKSPEFHYSFFNTTYEEMCQSHNFENQNAYLYDINKTNSGEYSYMKQNGLFARSYEEAYDIIKVKLPICIKLDKAFMIQMENNSLYEEIESNLDEIINDVIKINNIKIKYCKYIKVQNGNTIIVYNYS